jgi:hypothetical protein
MAKRSVFRDFVTAIRKHWQTELPEVRPIPDSLGPQLPKASTFYAGVSTTTKLHVFINLQHSPKPWEVGRFTVNLILLGQPVAREMICHQFAPEDCSNFVEGSYRIGDLLSSEDKWWRLKEMDPEIQKELLIPRGFKGFGPVVSQVEAVEDVTRDVRHALTKLGVRTSRDLELPKRGTS